MTIEIRRAVADDAAGASGVAQRAKASWGYPSEWLAAWEDELTISAVALETRSAFVATREGVMVGFAMIDSLDAHWELEHLWIDPSAQRSGVGTALFTAVMAEMSAGGGTRCTIASDPYAEAFYLSCGAIRVDKQPSPMPGAPDRFLPIMEWRAPPATA